MFKFVCLVALVALAYSEKVLDNKIKLTLKATKFTNPSGQNWKGQCCDSVFKRSTCKYGYERCDYEFKFCVESLMNSDQKNLEECKSTWVTGKGPDNSDSATLDAVGVKAATEFWNGVVIKFFVYDRDMFGKNELVDKGMKVIKPGEYNNKKGKGWGHVMKVGVHGHRKGETGADSTTMDFHFSAACADDYAGENCAHVAMASCAEWQIKNKDYKDGLYKLRDPNSQVYEGYCDMVEEDGKFGGWTVIQRRSGINGGLNSFNLNMKDYVNGFNYGGMTHDFWLGLRRMNYITEKYKSEKGTTLRIEATDCEGDKAYQEYDEFSIGDESDEWRLRVAQPDPKGTKDKDKKIRGTMGDAINTRQDFAGNPANTNGQPFSSKDNDKDGLKKVNCAKVHQGGWWFNACSEANLNGNIFLDSKCRVETKNLLSGAFWAQYRGFFYTMRDVKMKIRPANFNKRMSEQSKKRRQDDEEVWVP